MRTPIRPSHLRKRTQRQVRGEVFSESIPLPSNHAVILFTPPFGPTNHCPSVTQHSTISILSPTSCIPTTAITIQYP